MTQGNGPHMAAIIAAAEGGRYEPTPDEVRTDGVTYGYGADVEPHEPYAMSEQIIVRHCARMAAWL